MRPEKVATGKLITFEGGEGAGKSTQAALLAGRLTTAGRAVVTTREPGGSPLAEEIRDALLSGKVRELGPFAEALMFSVARQDHVDAVINNALAKGAWVVCDRFSDSTRAYQGVAGGVPIALLAGLERVTLRGLKPDLTLVLDLPPEQGLARAAKRPANDGQPDRFEAEQLSQHERIRKAFLDIADEEPNRCVVIDARKPESVVAEDIWEAVSARLRP